MYVPRWVCHHYRELAETVHVECTDITVDPLRSRHLVGALGGGGGGEGWGRGGRCVCVCVFEARELTYHSCRRLVFAALFLRRVHLSLRINLIVHKLTRIGVKTGVEEGAVSKTLVRVLLDYFPEM